MFFECLVLSLCILKVSASKDVACGPEQPEIINLGLGEEGFITSPGYAKHIIQPSANCSWILVGPINQKVDITFEDFQLSYHPLCFNNGFMIFNETLSQDQLLYTYCFDFSPPNLTVDSSVLFLHFYNDGSRPFRGFNIRVSTVSSSKKCNREEKTCRNGNCVSKKRICNGRDDCGDGTDEEKCSFPLTLYPKCGKQRAIKQWSDNQRIVGGKEAKPGKWPWQVGLSLNSQLHQCGATLINAQWIVTAAHCFRTIRGKKGWTVHLGKHRLDETAKTEQLRYIAKLIIHPKYNFNNPQKKEHDIALARLNAPVEINDFVYPVCLEKLNRKILDNTDMYVTGWGMTMGTGHELVLNEVPVRKVENNICKKIHREKYEITSKMVCAGNGTRDACIGDSGGPLVTEFKKKWYLIGIVSFGDSCGVAGKPGVYTDVDSYHQWIRKKMIFNYYS